jgi:hypothetical protein
MTSVRGIRTHGFFNGPPARPEYTPKVYSALLRTEASVTEFKRGHRSICEKKAHVYIQQSNMYKKTTGALYENLSAWYNKKPPASGIAVMLAKNSATKEKTR